MLSSVALLSGVAMIVAFLFTAFIQGVAYGVLHPTFNILFVSLVPNNRRGAAISMYQTAWDLGIGIMFGSDIDEKLGGYSISYFYGALVVVAAFILFKFKQQH